MQTLEFHPWSNLFPLLEGPAFEELVADIKANGVREPIITFHGKLLDGRNRLRACQAAGLEAPTREYEGTTPLLYVISLNLHRRHLDESQRAVIAAKISEISEVGRPSSDASDAISQGNAAEVMNVSRASVTRAKRVLKTAAPELVAEVEAGRVSVGAADTIVAEPLAEVIDAVRKGPRAVKKLASDARKKKKAARQAAAPAPAAVAARPMESITRNVRTSAARRALYLWREFLELKVEPAEFLKAAGAEESRKIARGMAKWFLELGRRTLAPRDKRTGTRLASRATVRASGRAAPGRKGKGKKIVRPKRARPAKLLRKKPARVVARRVVRHGSGARVSA